jgi:hypothetical protein
VSAAGGPDPSHGPDPTGGPEPTGGTVPVQATERDLVRPFIVTGGRSRASHPDIRVETLLERTEAAGNGAEHAASAAEGRSILLAITAGPTSVAEIGAHTGLPLGVVTILAGDLVEEGLVQLHHTDPVDVEVSALTRMIERVRAL